MERRSYVVVALADRYAAGPLLLGRVENLKLLERQGSWGLQQRDNSSRLQEVSVLRSRRRIKLNSVVLPVRGDYVLQAPRQRRACAKPVTAYASVRHDTSLDTEELIKVFIYTIYKLYGAPSTIISNRGSLFVFNFWCCLNQYLKVTLSLSSAQYPKIDSQTKIINIAINKYLYAFISFI